MPILDDARDLPFWRLVEQRAHLTPDRPMFADEHDREVTFGEFHDLATVTAHGLHSIGIGPGSVVAWQLPTTIDALVLMAAVTRLAAVQCPMIPILRERDVGHITSQLGADLIVVPEHFRGFAHGAMARDLAPAGASTWCLADGERIDDRARRAATSTGGEAPDLESLDRRAAAVRWIYYTSGTTSAPKGVRHTDRSLISSSTHLLGGIGLRPDDVVLTVTPIAHVGGVMTLVGQLLVGFRLALMSTFDRTATPAYASRREITVLRAPEPVLRACVAAQQEQGPDRLFGRVRMVNCGGAARSQQLNELVKETFGLDGVLSSYGMTECPGVSTTGLDDDPARIGDSSGRATPGTEIVVVGPDGRPCAAGVEGELHVGGPQLFAGYVDAALDDGAFDADGFFRSGDLGVVDADGFLRVTGRIKDIIIRNGENVSALEIEDVLGLHPAVASVAVIALPDARTGERVCAVIELEPGAEPLDLFAVAAWCTDAGLARQQVPEQVEHLAELPRNAMGKLQMAVLRARFAGDAV